MKLRKKTVFYIIAIIIILIIGFLIGVFYQEKKHISIDEKIRYSEILNWISTILIGIVVGYFLKNNYENNKIVKTYLLEDLKEISIEIVNISEHCYTFKKCTAFEDDQRKDIISKVNLLDKKIKVFADLLNDSYGLKFKEINDNLVNFLNSYNRKITSDGFYANPLENSYFDEIMAESSKFESYVRKITLVVIKKI